LENCQKKVEDANLISPEIVKSLWTFPKTPKFKKEVMKLIVTMMTENEIKPLRNAFKIMDHDNHGVITL